MNLYLDEQKAHNVASEKTLEAAILARQPGRSSGHARIVWRVRRKWRFFWEVYSK